MPPAACVQLDNLSGQIEAKTVVLGLASSGAHSNGYSLVRKIIERSKPDMNAKFDGERTLAEVVASMPSLRGIVVVPYLAESTGGWSVLVFPIFQ